MKRFLAFLLVLCLSATFFAGCGKTEDPQQPALQDQAPNEEQLPVVEDDGIMKILLIGHSLGVDSAYFFPTIAKNEGVENLVVGVLYHSGCRLVEHVDYLTANAAQYAYFEFDISKDTEWRRANADGSFSVYVPGAPNDTLITNGTIGQPMKFGIERHDWDLVVMQAGVFEAANASDAGLSMDFKTNIETIQNHVLENDIEPGSVPKFAWNITWTCPSDAMMNDAYKENLYQNFASQREMYETIISTFQGTVSTLHDWEYVFPAGTAVENAVTSKLQAEGVYRDFIHVNDFGRLMVAYTWYCAMFDKDISELEIKPVNYRVLNDEFARLCKEDMELTEEQKNILVESVSNALENPYQVTQSQYTK